MKSDFRSIKQHWQSKEEKRGSGGGKGVEWNQPKKTTGITSGPFS